MPEPLTPEQESLLRSLPQPYDWRVATRLGMVPETNGQSPWAEATYNAMGDQCEQLVRTPAGDALIATLDAERTRHKQELQGIAGELEETANGYATAGASNPAAKAILNGIAGNLQALAARIKGEGDA